MSETTLYNPNPKAVVFDFFDVVHRDPQKAFLANRGGRVNGYAVASDLLDTGQISYQEYIARFAEHAGMTPDEVLEEYAGAGLIQGTVDLIDDLTLGGEVPVYLLSNTCTEEITPLLEKYDLSRRFNRIFISSEIGLSKPNPAIFRHVLDTLGLRPDEVLMADDSPRNIAAATEEVGMHGHLFTEPDLLRNQLHGYGILAPVQQPAFVTAPVIL